MSEERLSKFQKWILMKTYKMGIIFLGTTDSPIYEYFDEHTKPNVQRAMVCQCLKNMIRKGLIQKHECFDFKWIRLTNIGFNAFLTVDKREQKYPDANLEDYKKRLESILWF